MVREVDAGRVVDGVGIDAAAGEREGDPRPLREAEVPAFGHDAPAQRLGVHPDRVVRRVADLGVRLRRRLDVGADAAVEEEVGVEREDGLDQPLAARLRAREAEETLRLGREHDALGRARHHGTARRERSRVVPVPAEAGAVEPLPLGEARRRVGIGVEEDVAVVEGRVEAEMRRAEEPVAEDVAAHVADAGDRERRRVGVDAELPEMRSHALPRAARGHAERLVVVAVRAARGEGVAQPEAAGLRDGIGQIGEARRPLVGGDHQIGILVIVHDEAARRDDPAGDHVVRQVEQRADEGPVGVGGRPAPHDEAALGPDRYDDRVLHGLRLHEAEDLRAEVLRAVAVTDAAPGHEAGAQVNALHRRAVDVDLVQRARTRQVSEAGGADLEGERLGHGRGEVVAPHGRLDRVAERPQRDVVAQALHRVEALEETLAERRRVGPPREARREALEEGCRGVGMAGERVDHQPARTHAALRGMPRVGAETVDRLPVEPRLQDQAAEGVARRPAGPHRKERVDQARTGGGVEPPPLPVLHEERLHEETRRPVRRHHHLILGERAEPEVLEHRHELGEDEWLARHVEAKRARVGKRAVVAERDAHRALAERGLEERDVDRGARRRRRRPILVGEGGAVARGEPCRLGGAVPRAQLVLEPLPPAPDEVAHGLPHVCQLGPGGARAVPGEGEGEERPVLEQHEVIAEAGTAGAPGQRLQDPLARLARQPVARQHDEGREAGRARAQRDDDVARPAGRHDRLDVGADLGRRRRE